VQQEHGKTGGIRAESGNAAGDGARQPIHYERVVVAGEQSMLLDGH